MVPKILLDLSFVLYKIVIFLYLFEHDIIFLVAVSFVTVVFGKINISFPHVLTSPLAISVKKHVSSPSILLEQNFDVIYCLNGE